MSDVPIRPGKLGNPDLLLRDDPRADPRLIAYMEQFGMAGEPPIHITGSASLPEILGYFAAAEEQSAPFFAMSVANMPEVHGVSTKMLTIDGVDGNQIKLFVHTPDDAKGPLPGIVHLHGGGMCILDAEGPLFSRYRTDLAAKNLIVIGVEFRNAAGKLGVHPFPAGLNDVSSAIQWIHANKGDLGISKIVVSGDSGGANLGLAATIKAKRDGRIDQIAGVYALCPYISNAYVDKLPELPSLYENDGLYTPLPVVAANAVAYDPTKANTTNPLAWPYHAKREDLEGLPPHVVSVNELDPFRDEGLGYYRKLMAAGVVARARTVNGTCHAVENFFMQAVPDIYHATQSDIALFAHSL